MYTSLLLVCGRAESESVETILTSCDWIHAHYDYFKLRDNEEHSQLITVINKGYQLRQC